MKPVLGVIYLEKRQRYLEERRLERLLEQFTNIYSINVVQITDRLLENETVENWPLCDVVLTLFLDKYNYATSVLEKIQAYTTLRAPLILNDCAFRGVLRSRIQIYEELHKLDILTPVFEIGRPQKITKPYIEKPESSDEHDIVIYHANNGGSTKINVKPEFGTKITQSQNCTPRFDECEVQDRTYIYETFLENATEVKIKVIGDNYAHGEAREATDKGVQRDTANKREAREPIELTKQELEYAAKIQRRFKQFFIGFDVLRHGGKSYVIDVNDQAWLPKTGRDDFFQNAAFLMGQKIMREAPHLLLTVNINNPSSDMVQNADLGVVL